MLHPLPTHTQSVHTNGHTQTHKHTHAHTPTLPYPSYTNPTQYMPSSSRKLKSVHPPETSIHTQTQCRQSRQLHSKADCTSIHNSIAHQALFYFLSFPSVHSSPLFPIVWVMQLWDWMRQSFFFRGLLYTFVVCFSLRRAVRDVTNGLSAPWADLSDRLLNGSTLTSCLIYAHLIQPNGRSRTYVHTHARARTCTLTLAKTHR